MSKADLGKVKLQHFSRRIGLVIKICTDMQYRDAILHGLIPALLLGGAAFVLFLHLDVLLLTEHSCGVRSISTVCVHICSVLRVQD